MVLEELVVKKILRLIGILIGVTVLLAVGYMIRGAGEPRPSDDDAANQVDVAEGEDVVWTCSMHPQIRQPEPGRCPICDMELIPVEDDDEGRLAISEEARRLAEIEVAPVERRFVSSEIRLPGKIDYDETRIKNVAARVGGRLDYLFADYTGIQVEKGLKLAEIYSPELFSAQQELLQARRSLDEAQAAQSRLLISASENTLRATRERLRLWGFTREQVAEIEERGHPVDHLAIHSPISGTVIKQHVKEGDYVSTGSPIYTIYDFSHVWVKLDAYETDLPWLAFGQEVEFEVGAYPGESFSGRIIYIDPFLTERTRSVQVRLNAKNPGGRLRPAMFVRAVLRSELDAEGNVIAPDYSGKWISPNHPEIIKDEPGECDICGQPLVPAEQLGLVRDKEPAPPLVIPQYAPLITGKRAIVYVEVPDAERPTFEGREVVLGPRAGDYYIVKSGLQEGELVVKRGAFKIDSALQIRGRPSMMSPEEEEDEATSAFDIPDDFGEHIDEVLVAYFSLQRKLADDDAEGAADAAAALIEKLEFADPGILGEDARSIWEAEADKIRDHSRSISETDDIDLMRESFVSLSKSLETIVRRLGAGGGVAVNVANCPMAFGEGADWLQQGDEIFNPYYGEEMLGCGEITETLVSEPHDH